MEIKLFYITQHNYFIFARVFKSIHIKYVNPNVLFVDEQEDEDVNELRLVPRNVAQIQAMYDALCECQLLHPDPEDSVSEESDQEDQHGCGGDHNGTEDMEVADGQFDDAI